MYIKHKDKTNYMCHHGIKGMHWGTRNGPPYPLKPSAHTAEERKYITRKDSKASGSDELAVFGIEAAAILGATAVYVTVARSVQLNRNKKMYDKDVERRDIDTLDEAPKLKKPMATSDSVKVVNPGYPDEPGTLDNCTYCTAALALREKGYDVKAVKTEEGLYTKTRADWFTVNGKNVEYVRTKKAKESKDVISELSKQGDNAYGELTLSWAVGGGHSVFWKNENGKTYIYDGQSGIEYNGGSRDFLKILDKTYLKGNQYRRLDNAEASDRVLGAVTKG